MRLHHRPVHSRSEDRVTTNTRFPPLAGLAAKKFGWRCPVVSNGLELQLGPRCVDHVTPKHGDMVSMRGHPTWTGPVVGDEAAQKAQLVDNREQAGGRGLKFATIINELGTVTNPRNSPHIP